MASSRRLEVVIAGDPKGALGAISAVDASAGGLGGTFKRAGVAAVAGFAVVGAAAVGAGLAAFKIGENFDDAYDTIRTRTGATGDVLDGLKDSFRNVVSSVPTDFGSASDAISDLNQRLGLTGRPLEGLSRRFLELSRLTETDLAGNIEGLTGTFNQWGISTDEMPARLDELFRATQVSGIGIDELGAQMQQFGPDLRALGFSFDDAAGLLSSFEQAGINTGPVMAGLKAGLKDFAAAGKDPQEEFARMVEGIANGSVTMQDATGVFGRGFSNVYDAIRSGHFDIDAVTASIAGGSDTIMAASRDTRDFGEQWTMIKNRVLVGLEPVATRVFTGIGDAMTRLGPVVAQVGTWLAENIPPAFERIRAIAEDVWPRVRDAFLGAVSAISGWWSTNGPAIMGALTSLQGAFSSAFDAISVIVTNWAGVISNLWDRFGGQWLTHLQTAFSAITQVFQGAVDIIKGILDVFVGIFTGDWGRAWDGVKSIFSGAWDLIAGVARLAINAVSGIIGAGMALISAAWGYAWDAIKAAFSAVWDAIKSVVHNATERVKSVLSAAWDAIKATATTAWDAIKGVFDAVWDAIKLKVHNATERVKEVLSSAWDAVKATAQTAWDAITGVVTDALDGIKEGMRIAKAAMKTIWDGIKGIFRAPVSAVLSVVVNPFLGFLDDVAGVVGLSVPHNFSLPEFHSGGMVPGRGPIPAMLLGGEGVVNPEAMRELGPTGLAAINRGEIGSGPVDIITDVLGPQPILQGFTQEVLDRVLSGMRSLIAKINDVIPGDWLRAPMRVVASPLQAILDFVAREGPGKVMGGAFGPGMIWQQMFDVVHAAIPSATLNSGYRPGAITATGNQSRHALGRAVDFGGPLGEIFEWIASHYPNAYELIYSPAGNRQIYHGAPHWYSEPTRGDHWDHVHWSMQNGGIVKGGRGGVYAHIGEGRHDELVTPLPAGGAIGGDTHIHIHMDNATLLGSSQADVERFLVAGLDSARRKGLVGA